VDYVTGGEALYGSHVTKTAPKYAVDTTYDLATAGTRTIQIREDPAHNVIQFFYWPIKYRATYQIVPGWDGKDGGSLTLTSEYDVETFEGSRPIPAANYEFVGWFTDPSCADQYKVEDGPIATIEANNHLTPIRREDNGEPITDYVFYAKFNLLAADFTITKNNATPGQVFVYLLENEEKTLSIEVAVEANGNGYGSTTIADLPFGNYTVTQLNSGWSWRHGRDVGMAVVHNGTADSNFVEFNDAPNAMQWLIGIGNLIRRIFGGT